MNAHLAIRNQQHPACPQSPPQSAASSGAQLLRRSTAVWLGLLLMLAGGCILPRARLVKPNCRCIQRGEALESLACTVTLETEGLVGEQLVYEVSLVDAQARPIDPSDRRPQNQPGPAAARRTLVVLQSPNTLADLPLSVPAGQVKTRAGDWPALARFRVCNVDGECLAETMCAVPPEPGKRMAAARPPRETAERAAAEARKAALAKGKGRSTTIQPTTRPAKPPQAAARPATPPTASQPAKTTPPKDRSATTQPTTRPAKPPQPTTRPAAPPATTQPAKPASAKDRSATSQPTTRPAQPDKAKPKAATSPERPPATTQPAKAASSKSRPATTQPSTQPTKPRPIRR